MVPAENTLSVNKDKQANPDNTEVFFVSDESS